MPESADAEARPDRAAYQELEAAVNRALAELDRLREVSTGQKKRVAELEGLLSRFSEGRADPASIERENRALEEENRELLQRMSEAREVVERLQARIRFLEENG